MKRILRLLYTVRVALSLTTIGALSALPLAGIDAWGAQDQSREIVAGKTFLRQKLDSIDVEKQIRKRKGMALDDLEKAAATIKDSITALRHNAEKFDQTPSEHRPAQSEEAVGLTVRLTQKYMPRNVFDWVVLIVGAVAVIAGVILCIGLCSMIFGKLKSKKTGATRAVQAARPQPLTDTPIGHASALAALKSEQSERTIESLRKRIEEDNDAAASSSAGVFPVKQPDGAPNAAPAEVNKNIVEAARQGVSIVELSRRFHMSTDQISLIVRIARKQSPS